MRIHDPNSAVQLSVIELGLTIAEAIDLRDVLDTLLHSDPGRHEHVASSDYQTQLIVSVVDR